MIKQKVYLTFAFIIILTSLNAQKLINQLDNQGKRHGVWTKNYHKTDQKRYEGQFKHGKEIDTFNFYTLSGGKSVLSAVKVFNEKDSMTDVTFYSSTKKVISKGKMNGKRSIGQWIYYHKNSSAKMIIENFDENGKLDGERKVLYLNGVVGEISFYKEGKLHGESKLFSERGKLLKHSYYKNDLLNGKTINYDTDGHIISEGDYLDDKKSAIWKYYKSGKITKEIDHTNQVVIKKYQ